MISPNVKSLRAPYRAMGWVCVALFLCVCVLSQMLGAPVTMVNLFTSADLLTESVSEESSLPSTVLEPDTPGPFRFNSESQPPLHLRVFVTSVFHPPQA
jgi:hypothetical protein